MADIISHGRPWTTPDEDQIETEQAAAAAMSHARLVLSGGSAAAAAASATATDDLWECDDLDDFWDNEHW